MPGQWALWAMGIFQEATDVSGHLALNELYTEMNGNPINMSGQT